MQSPTDVIRGAIKLDNFQEGKCFTGIDDYTKALPSMLTVEIPTDATNVTIGVDEPGADARDNLWVRKDPSGSFIGFYVYAAGGWKLVSPPPGQLILMYGDSRVIPDGYTLASNDPHISAAMLAHLQLQWMVGGLTPTWYNIFHVTYTGF